MIKLIEVMARAASDAFCTHAEYTEDQIEEHWQCNKQSYIEEQTAALTAIHTAGYAVVPVEPTEEMTTAAIEADDKRTGAETCKHIYRAMIEATK